MTLPKADSDYGRILALLMASAGLLTLASLLFINTRFFKLIQPDRAFDAMTLWRFRSVQTGLMVVGCLSLAIGLAAYRFKWLNFLSGRKRLANWLLLALCLAYPVGIGEFILRIEPMTTIRQNYLQSIHYEPTAFSVHKLVREQDIYDEGEPPQIRAIIRNGYRGESIPVAKPAGETRLFFFRRVVCF